MELLQRFDNFPMPPSVNSSLALFRGRLIKTARHREFQSLCEIWAYANFKRIQEIRAEMGKWSERRFFHINYVFNFPHTRIFSQKNTVKKIDVTNRIKPVEDAIFKILGLDDSLVFSGSFSKCIAENRSSSVTILICTTREGKP